MRTRGKQFSVMDCEMIEKVPAGPPLCELPVGTSRPLRYWHQESDDLKSQPQCTLKTTESYTQPFRDIAELAGVMHMQ